MFRTSTKFYSTPPFYLLKSQLSALKSQLSHLPHPWPVEKITPAKNSHSLPSPAAANSSLPMAPKRSPHAMSPKPSATRQAHCIIYSTTSKASPRPSIAQRSTNLPKPSPPYASAAAHHRSN